MNSEERPSPDELLEAIKMEEKNVSKGKLKIFLGMAAGVGKTFAMLKEAQQLKKEGVSLVVGIVDTHGRQETAILMQELKVIPQRKILYKNQTFYEMDIDGILALHPQLVLVDELAHSNIPGARHTKRWQDVMEILENGIDVYTTLNVQHIESLNDVVEGITHVSVRETVPDVIIETATNIQLVDLTPEELLQRLKEGKVYHGDQSTIAASNFFKKDRLTALREIVLRYAAEKVDRDLHIMVKSVEQQGGWKPREKLLVAVSHSPHSQKLLRATRRISFNLDAPWIAVHVNRGESLSEADNNQLAKNIALARDLGAEVITTNDPSIAEGIKRIAKQRGVTQIILGRPPKRFFLDIFLGYPLLDKLATECEDIDIHVIRKEKTSKPYRKGLPWFNLDLQYSHYLAVIIFTLILSVVNWYLLPYLGYRIVGFIFLLSLLGLSLYFKKGPVFFASVLYALIWEFVFVSSTTAFEVNQREDNAFLALYFFTAIATGILVDRSREHQEMLAKREEWTQALYDIVRQIATAPSVEDLLKSIKAFLHKLISGQFEFIIKQKDNGLALDKPSLLISDEKEKSTAIWVFEKGKEAGWSTSTLPSARNLYIPIKSFNETLGVILYHPKLNRNLTTEEKNFIYTVGQQVAYYIERNFNEARQREIESLNQEEKIYQMVLKKISEELKDPLESMSAAIKGAANTLLEEQENPQKKAVEGQIHKIENSSERLLRILESVSAMAKLSGTLIPINKSKQSIKEVIEACVSETQKNLGTRILNVKIADNLPLASFDFSLIEILLHNLIFNAIDYSPPDSQIEIEAKQADHMLIVSVCDQGQGIPPDQLDAVFEKFYRVPGTALSGMGLGLAIAKKIAEIHQGQLKVENRPESGAKFSLYLPINH